MPSFKHGFSIGRLGTAWLLAAWSGGIAGAFAQTPALHGNHMQHLNDLRFEEHLNSNSGNRFPGSKVECAELQDSIKYIVAKSRIRWEVECVPGSREAISRSYPVPNSLYGERTTRYAQDKILKSLLLVPRDLPALYRSPPVEFTDLSECLATTNILNRFTPNTTYNEDPAIYVTATCEVVKKKKNLTQTLLHLSVKQVPKTPGTAGIKAAPEPATTGGTTRSAD